MPRLFVYLDEYKLSSISSQIFEGLTEEVIQYSEDTSSQGERQKGKLGSGQLLADIVAETRGRAEKRFLFDYGYTIFEQRLVDEDRVLDLDHRSRGMAPVDFAARSFIRVTGRMQVTDLAAVNRTAKEFNKMMSAFSYVATNETRTLLREMLNEQLATAKGQSRNEIQRQIKELQNAHKEETVDPLFMEQLTYLLEYGFGDHIEMQVRIPEEAGYGRTHFTAVLDREALREPANALVKKYSRQTESAFTVFGVITQHTGDRQSTHFDNETSSVDPGSVPGAEGEAAVHVRAALGQMTGHIHKLEDGFFGRLSNEVIIDPIAVYREL